MGIVIAWRRFLSQPLEQPPQMVGTQRKALGKRAKSEQQYTPLVSPVTLPSQLREEVTMAIDPMQHMNNGSLVVSSKGQLHCAQRSQWPHWTNYNYESIITMKAFRAPLL